MNETYVGRHRRPDDDHSHHRPGDTDTLRLKIARRAQSIWTRDGYPPAFPADSQELFTHPDRLHGENP